MYIYICIYIYIERERDDFMCIYIYIYIYRERERDTGIILCNMGSNCMVAIFCPFGLFCEIVSSLLSLQSHQEQPSIYFRQR